MHLIKALRIQSAHGIQGYVNAISYFEDKKLLNRGVCFYMENATPFIKISKIKHLNQNKYHILFDGISDRDAAEALKGKELFISRDYLPQTKEDEFYHEDLKKYTVYNTSHIECGKIVAIHNYGAGDFFEIQLHNGQSATLPFTKEAVLDIMPSENKIVIDENFLLL